MTLKITVLSSKYNSDGSVLFELRITDNETGESEDVTNCYRSDDPYSGELGQKLATWIDANQASITPYVPPAPLTPEQVRAQMPNLTARQFWMAAANIDIDKDVIIATVKANMEDSVERKIVLAELETSTFVRISETITEIMAMLEIPDEQVDSLWVWAAGL